LLSEGRSREKKLKGTPVGRETNTPLKREGLFFHKLKGIMGRYDHARREDLEREAQKKI